MRDALGRGAVWIRTLSASTIANVRGAIARRLDSRSWRRQAGLVLTVLGVLLFAVRVLAAAWPTQYKIFFPDSFSFKNAARDTPLSFEFYADERPMAYPALLFMLGRSTVFTVVVQTLLYAGAFVGLIAVAFRLLRNAEARVVALALLVLLACQSRFALWNTHILSESFGITLGVTTVLAWWFFGARPTATSLRWAALATILWITVRDSNIPPWVAVGVPALLIGSRLCRALDPALRRAMLRWGVITLVVAVAATLGQAANGRNRYATMNNVGLRVLVDPQLTDWFVDEGMPISPALRERTNKSSFDDDWKMLVSPELAVFRRWADDVGQREMAKSYVRFAPHWLDMLYKDLPVLLASDQVAYDAFGVAKRMPGPLPAQLGGPTSRTGLWLWCCVAASGLLLGLRRRLGQSIVLGLLLLSCAIDVYMAYVGDSVEVQRHMVGPVSRLTVILMVCAFVGLDALIDIVRRADATPHAEEVVADV